MQVLAARQIWHFVLKCESLSHEMETGPDHNEGSSKGTLLTAVAALGLLTASAVGFAYKQATEQECTADQKEILAGIDVFHRRQASFFQEEYDKARTQLPQLPKMNFRELGLSSEKIMQGSTDTEYRCVERTWTVTAVESVQNLVMGGTWDLRSNVEQRKIYVKPELFSDSACHLVSGKIHEDVHLARLPFNHDDVDTREEAMQNPLFNYEQSAELRCQTTHTTYSDLRRLGKKDAK